ncbi:MAG: efflux RND transporter periplasmic adaptor subunit [Chthoniobacteraceae bacterium]
MRRRTLAIALAMVTAFLPAGCTKKAEEKADEAGPKIEGDKVTLPANSPQKSSLATEVAKAVDKTVMRMTGRLTWNEDATVRVFAPVAGRVDKIFGMPGHTIREGDTLATLYSPDFAQAQADASRAVSGLKLSERTLSRTKELFEHGAAAKKDLEAAEDDLEAKRSENERAQARLQQYGAALGTVDGRFPLKAPLTGTIVEKNINPGQEVRADQILAGIEKLTYPLFVISDPSKLTVMLDVTELDIAGLRPGEKIEVQSRAYPDRIFEGKLDYIGQSLDPLTRTVKARGHVDNKDGLLKAEMYVSVDVTSTGADNPPPGSTAVTTGGDSARPRAASAALEIPAKAVFFKDNKHFVFVENAPDKYERQPVEVGAEHQGRVRITRGLNPGQRVVTEGSLLLQAMTEGGKE